MGYNNITNDSLFDKDTLTGLSADQSFMRIKRKDFTIRNG